MRGGWIGHSNSRAALAESACPTAGSSPRASPWTTTTCSAVTSGGITMTAARNCAAAEIAMLVEVEAHASARR
jgi:hypothetical protein